MYRFIQINRCIYIYVYTYACSYFTAMQAFAFQPEAQSFTLHAQGCTAEADGSCTTYRPQYLSRL